MKKIFLSACAALALISVVIAQDKKEEVKLSYREVGSILPPLRVIDTLRKEYTAADFKDKHNFFLVMFNPTCDHCVRMARLIDEHEAEFKKNKVLFLATAAMMPYLPGFHISTGITNKSPIKIGVDSASTVDRLYEYKTLPQINIYDKERRLIKIFHGDVPLDSLKRYMQ